MLHFGQCPCQCGHSNREFYRLSIAGRFLISRGGCPYDRARTPLVDPGICAGGSFADKHDELTRSVEGGALTPELWAITCQQLAGSPLRKRHAGMIRLPIAGLTGDGWSMKGAYRRKGLRWAAAIS